MFKFVSLTLIAIQVLSCSAVKPWEPERRDTTEYFHKKFLEYGKAHAKDIEIIFYGDSLTMGWNGNGHDVWQKHYANLHAVNFGIGGDRTQNVIWRIENGEIDGLNPKVVVLLIGGNNLFDLLSGETSENIVKGIKTIVDLLNTKLPHTKILLLGLFPTGIEMAMPFINAINIMLSKFANGNTIQFLNMDKQLEEPNGHYKASLYYKDKIHLVSEGYEVWAQTMDPLLHKMLGINRFIFI